MILKRSELVCRQAVEMVSDYLEGALPRAARRRLERHLAACPHCTAYLAQMRETLRLTGKLAPEDLTAEMQEEFTEIFRRWRAEDNSD